MKGSNIKSLRGTAADLVRYLGMTARVLELIEKLELTYGTVASFGTLMQNFYHLQQNKEKRCKAM